MSNSTTQLPLFPLERVCTDCGETKPLEQFARGNAAYGRKSYCKPCQTKRMQDYRTRNAQKVRELPTEKRCPACERTLPPSDFYVARGEKDGLQRYCKACKDGQNIEWAKTHNYDQKAYRASHYQKNWHRQRSLARQWKKTNRMRDREHVMRYWARKHAATIGKVDYAAILERDKGICYLCGLPIPDGELHFDHVIPLSRGGAHTMDNIRATHEWCNLSKHDKTPEEYLAAYTLPCQG